MIGVLLEKFGDCFREAEGLYGVVVLQTTRQSQQLFFGKAFVCVSVRLSIFYIAVPVCVCLYE